MGPESGRDKDSIEKIREGVKEALLTYAKLPELEARAYYEILTAELSNAGIAVEKIREIKDTPNFIPPNN